MVKIIPNFNPNKWDREKILDYVIGDQPLTDEQLEFLNYFDKLQRENKEQKNKIDSFNLEINKWLENSKTEMREYGDNHEKYWGMFNLLIDKIKNKLIDISDCVIIDREREEELLNNEYILTEFEKWLLGGKMMFYQSSDGEQLIRYGEICYKLQELKEGNKKNE